MQGYGANLSGSTIRLFLNALPPAPTPWDPGFHVPIVAPGFRHPDAAAATSTSTPTVSPAPRPAPRPATASPVGSSTNTPFTQPLGHHHPDGTVTPYPIQRDRVITYPNPYHPNAGLQNIVFDPADDASIKLFDMNSQLCWSCCQHHQADRGQRSLGRQGQGRQAGALGPLFLRG